MFCQWYTVWQSYFFTAILLESEISDFHSDLLLHAILPNPKRHKLNRFTLSSGFSRWKVMMEIFYVYSLKQDRNIKFICMLALVLMNSGNAVFKQ